MIRRESMGIQHQAGKIINLGACLMACFWTRRSFLSGQGNSAGCEERSQTEKQQRAVCVCVSARRHVSPSSRCRTNATVTLSCCLLSLSPIKQPISVGFFSACAFIRQCLHRYFSSPGSPWAWIILGGFHSPIKVLLRTEKRFQYCSS